MGLHLAKNNNRQDRQHFDHYYLGPAHYRTSHQLLFPHDHHLPQCGQPDQLNRHSSDPWLQQIKDLSHLCLLEFGACAQFLFDWFGSGICGGRDDGTAEIDFF